MEEFEFKRTDFKLRAHFLTTIAGQKFPCDICGGGGKIRMVSLLIYMSRDVVWHEQNIDFLVKPSGVLYLCDGAAVVTVLGSDGKPKA